ncbi:MAG: MarR family winged helix-turn-helix transcriptional regulator [Pseudomonadota bacterium]
MEPDADDPMDLQEPPSLRLSEFLPYRLSVLSNTVSSGIADAYGARFGLTIWQWRCMAVIGETPGLAARDVAARTAMDKVAVSRAVGGLEALGHVRRSIDPNDRRASHLELSASGRRVYDEIVPLALAYEKRLLEVFSDVERDQLVALLGKLAETATDGKDTLW